MSEELSQSISQQHARQADENNIDYLSKEHSNKIKLAQEVLNRIKDKATESQIYEDTKQLQPLLKEIAELRKKFEKAAKTSDVANGKLENMKRQEIALNKLLATKRSCVLKYIPMARNALQMCTHREKKGTYSERYLPTFEDARDTVPSEESRLEYLKQVLLNIQTLSTEHVTEVFRLTPHVSQLNSLEQELIEFVKKQKRLLQKLHALSQADTAGLLEFLNSREYILEYHFQHPDECPRLRNLKHKNSISKALHRLAKRTYSQVALIDITNKDSNSIRWFVPEGRADAYGMGTIAYATDGIYYYAIRPSLDDLAIHD